jgi:hypothetical protein
MTAGGRRASPAWPLEPSFRALLVMNLDSRLVQRLILAFTTGLFLSCAARVSAVQAGGGMSFSTSALDR